VNANAYAFDDFLTQEWGKLTKFLKLRKFHRFFLHILSIFKNQPVDFQAFTIKKLPVLW